MIKSWIFSRSTLKGLLKNVQDRVSRPLGGQEIQKNKSGNSFAGHPVDAIQIKLRCNQDAT